MKKKQKGTKGSFQAAKRRELIQKESGGDENRVVSLTYKHSMVLQIYYSIEFKEDRVWLSPFFFL